MSKEWWRSAVIYQIYPRSFADSTGDGVGDIPGIERRLPALAELGVDAVWLSPFYVSPQHDAGYDVADYCDVEPCFGTLADFDSMLAEAHRLGLKLIVDLVPNHSSWDHAWFKAALKAKPGSHERSRYWFRPGRGRSGDEPPNDWESVFGGGAWERTVDADGTPGEWYLHLFDKSQPDFNWTSHEVREEFRRVLRFWLDRGVDGFRVDVAHGLVKKHGLPNWREPSHPPAMNPPTSECPYWAQPGVHEIYRDWHKLVAGYEGDRVLAGEAWVQPLSDLANWVRADELNQTFNFTYLETEWNAESLKRIVTNSIAAFSSVDAPSTWVLSNHDVIRHATRLGLSHPIDQGAGIGPNTNVHVDAVVGLARARAATQFMLALPGSAYIYQGEELGLPEVIDIPDADRQDPTWFRTEGKRYGRDGERVPIPWSNDTASYGFGPSGKSWLPQPKQWAELARDRQQGVPGSTLTLYQTALRLRREYELGNGEVEWAGGLPEDTLGYRNGGVFVFTNFADTAVPLPDGEVLLRSDAAGGPKLAGNSTAWIASGN